MGMPGYCVAVIGATTSAGREVVAALRQRQFAVSGWRLYDSAEALGCEDADLDLPVSLLDSADLDGVDLVFCCGAEASTAAWISRAERAGALVVDLSQTVAENPEVPLIVPEVNAETAAELGERRVVAVPVPGATALSVVLKPLHEAAVLKRVVVATYQAVSGAGNPGIEELGRQTADLLNGCSVEHTVFPRRIAFNLVPQVGEFLSGGRSRGEWQIEFQTRRILGLPELPLSVTAVWVPTFFGDGYAVNVETEGPLDAERARELLREAPGIVLMDDLAENVYPSASDAVGEEATFVGRVRDDTGVPYGINLWVTVDGLCKGTAVNAVQIAELLVREGL